MTLINQNLTNSFNIKILGVKRRRFTESEDILILHLIKKIGIHNWNTIAKFLPGRTGKQCRDRFYNYLKEPHTFLPWTKEEDDMLLRLLKIVGPKWAAISKYIPKRSGNDLKNRWHKHLSKEHSNILNQNDANSTTDLSQEKSEYHLDESLEKYSISSLLIQ